MPWFQALSINTSFMFPLQPQEESADAGRDSNLPDLDGVCLERFCPCSHTFFTVKFICPWCSPWIISFPVSLPKKNHFLKKFVGFFVRVKENGLKLPASLIPINSGFLLLPLTDDLTCVFPPSWYPYSIYLQCMLLFWSKFQKLHPSCCFSSYFKPYSFKLPISSVYILAKFTHCYFCYELELNYF